jgi:hypothetical protein
MQPNFGAGSGNVNGYTGLQQSLQSGFMNNLLNSLNQGNVADTSFSPASQQQAPYQYADTSTSLLFPSMNMASGGGSGAGRFMAGAPMNDFMGGFTPQNNYTNTYTPTYTPSEFVMPVEEKTTQWSPAFSIGELQTQINNGRKV